MENFGGDANERKERGTGCLPASVAVAHLDSLFHVIEFESNGATKTSSSDRPDGFGLQIDFLSHWMTLTAHLSQA